jgi:Acyl-CoA synthetases (AMP-forming)/AMP-acid ligases II
MTLINTGGEKVWPDEVEAALREHPGVRDVAAGGRLDPEWGQRVAVWVVPADPADPPSLEELRAFAARTLPRYAAPRELTLRSGSRGRHRASFDVLRCPGTERA